MPIQCRMIDYDLVDRKDIKPGDMWYAPWYIEGGKRMNYLTDEYARDWMDKRPPLVVRLPDGTSFMVDCRCTVDGVLQDHGWTVTGEPPNITVSPSINIIGYYHGWLQNGILSDDVEGRTYVKK
jgi:hypothetical protein